MRLREVGVSSMGFSKINRFPARTGMIAGCLVAVYYFQISYLSSFDIEPRISLFYLPAAVITLSTLTFRFGATPGIFAGYLAINLSQNGILQISTLALSLAPPIVAALTTAILSVSRQRIGIFLKPRSTIADIDALDVLFFCAAYGLINTALHHLLFFIDEDLTGPVSPLSAMQMMFGDLTGSFLGFIALNLGYSIVTRVWRTIKSTRSPFDPS